MYVNHYHYYYHHDNRIHIIIMIIIIIVDVGNAFGKYAPIIKDVTFDVYNEFKEFLEENRELELLAKQVLK